MRFWGAVAEKSGGRPWPRRDVCAHRLCLGDEAEPPLGAAVGELLPTEAPTGAGSEMPPSFPRTPLPQPCGTTVPPSLGKAGGPRCAAWHGAGAVIRLTGS